MDTHHRAQVVRVRQGRERKRPAQDRHQRASTAVEWKPGDEPYYPVNDAKNGALYAEYKKLADAEPKVIFGGRLGEYKYYDMDQVIAAVLDRCDTELQMIRVAMVEDEAAVRDQLMGYVQRCMRQYDAQIEVTMFTDGVEILEEYRPVYDIIFLDVEMQHLDGMETASRIRALDSDVLLIFITNMAQYAIKGYAVGALDYVLKPVPYFAFSQQLQKAAGQLARRARRYLAVPVDGGMRRLDEASVYYIESEGHRIHFYTEDGDFSAPGALESLGGKAWNPMALPAATAAIWSIWRMFPACR